MIFTYFPAKATTGVAGVDKTDSGFLFGLSREASPSAEALLEGIL